MNRSTPGLPVHHQLLEFTQTHVHLVSDAIDWQPWTAGDSLTSPAGILQTGLVREWRRGANKGINVEKIMIGLRY